MEIQRYFLNPGSVSKHLYCSICQDVFNEPQRAPCGHSFCKQCIYMWLLQSKSCPEDRRPVTKKELHYDFILANIIGDQIVACPFRSKGCEHVGKLEYLTSHKKSCTFNPVNLPDFMKEEENNPSTTISKNDVDSDYDEEKLPTPAKPSLKMRLFRDESKRQLLKSVFQSNVTLPRNTPTNRQTGSSKRGKVNVWLGKGETKKTKPNHSTTDVILLDDSF